jgi:crossover junction endodeoxyribonuclease RuvC
VDASALLPRLLQVKSGRPLHAIVERQQAMSGQGVSSTFTTGCAFGSLLATLQAAGCSIEFVTAATWKRATGLSQDKAAGLDRARLLYPQGGA